MVGALLLTGLVDVAVALSVTGTDFGGGTEAERSLPDGGRAGELEQWKIWDTNQHLF